MSQSNSTPWPKNLYFKNQEDLDTWIKKNGYQPSSMPDDPATQVMRSKYLRDPGASVAEVSEQLVDDLIKNGISITRIRAEELFEQQYMTQVPPVSHRELLSRYLKHVGKLAYYLGKESGADKMFTPEELAELKELAK